MMPSSDSIQNRPTNSSSFDIIYLFYLFAIYSNQAKITNRQTVMTIGLPTSGISKEELLFGQDTKDEGPLTKSKG